MKKVNELFVIVLGTKYIVTIKTQEEMRAIAQTTTDDSYFNGLCDFNAKAIYIDSEVVKDKISFNATLRHEIVHAFFFESGLNSQCLYATCEENVDWIALQSKKIFKAFEELDILD